MLFVAHDSGEEAFAKLSARACVFRFSHTIAVVVLAGVSHASDPCRICCSSRTAGPAATHDSQTAAKQSRTSVTLLEASGWQQLVSLLVDR